MTTMLEQYSLSRLKINVAIPYVNGSRIRWKGAFSKLSGLLLKYHYVMSKL